MSPEGHRNPAELMPGDKQVNYQSPLPEASASQTRLLLSPLLEHLPNREKGKLTATQTVSTLTARPTDL